MPATGLPEWLPAWGPPQARGRLRAEPEHFVVTEIPLIEPGGDGAHLWLEVRKRNANTNWVAEQLARAAGIAPRDVGFAGMKDRRAVTTQWFSLNLQEADNADFQGWQIPDVTIVQAQRHTRKLQRGALRGNRFRITVIALRGDPADLERRLRCIAQDGVPNYFGEQRFGHDGRNVQRAAHWLERGGRVRRNDRSIFISALRSFLFNQVLQERVKMGNWNRLLDGDLAQLDGKRSLFPCTLPDAELERRCADFDIHPTGPLPGRPGLQPERACADLEQSALEPYAAWIAGLERIGAEADRRSLRLWPRDIAWQRDGEQLLLEFMLPPGAYATTLLRELVLDTPDSISGAS